MSVNKTSVEEKSCPYRPVTSSSLSDAPFLNFFHISIVNSVAALLKIEVKELIRADIITAIIRPFSPENVMFSNEGCSISV